MATNPTERDSIWANEETLNCTPWRALSIIIVPLVLLLIIWCLCCKCCRRRKNEKHPSQAHAATPPDLPNRDEQAESTPNTDSKRNSVSSSSGCDDGFDTKLDDIMDHFEKTMGGESGIEAKTREIVEERNRLHQELANMTADRDDLRTQLGYANDVIASLRAEAEAKLKQAPSHPSSATSRTN
jgi:flagellar biosynthesis/type III secretory pathway M-ring protein FliF/YscJ